VQIPLILHLGAASQAVPLVAVVLARKRPSPAIVWTVAWCAFLVAVDAATLALGWGGHRNLFLYYLVTPVASALALWALSLWQRAELSRLSIRLAIVPFLAAWGGLTYAFEDLSSFSRVAEPLASLVCLGAAAVTLVARSYSARTSLLRQDWFWVCGGMVLYFGTMAMLPPLSALLVGGSQTLLVRAYEFKSVLDALAFLAITRGVMCKNAT
jgi:hypothetical protein